jgi:hypothetical protein
VLSKLIVNVNEKFSNEINQIYNCVCELLCFHFFKVTVPVPEPELITGTVPVLVLLRSEIKLRSRIRFRHGTTVGSLRFRNTGRTVPTVPKHWSISIKSGIFFMYCSNPDLMRLHHWPSDTLTTRLDFIHIRLDLISSKPTKL